jgi:hypothetical protein
MASRCADWGNPTQLSLFESELITATFQTNLEFWVSSMNMRLKELAATVAGKPGPVPADVAAPIMNQVTSAPVQASQPQADVPSPAPAPDIHQTPLPPPATLVSATKATPAATVGGKMTSIAELAAKITANRTKRDQRTTAVAQKASDLDTKADQLLDASEAQLEQSEHDLNELEASLNPQMGGNGGEPL